MGSLPWCTVMASLARIRFAKRLVCVFILTRQVSAYFFLLAWHHPASSTAPVQTTADKTELHEKPADLSQPITLKLREDSFRLNDDRVITTIQYGDGASNQGQVFEAFNSTVIVFVFFLPPG